MINNRVLIGLLLLLAVAGKTVMAQEGEVILASEHMKEAEKSANRAMLRSRFKFPDSIRQKSLFFIAYRPRVRTYRNIHYNPIRTTITDPKNGYGHSMVAGFETFLGKWPVTLRVENITRLQEAPDNTYDYGSLYFLANRRPSSFNATAIEHFTNLNTTDISFRYYFNLRERMQADVSGRNMYHRYLYFQVRDLVSYSRKINEVYNPTTRELVSKREAKGLFVNPHYISLGIGQQLRIFTSMFVDFRLGLSYAHDRRVMKLEAHNGLLVDAALNIGLALGKKH